MNLTSAKAIDRYGGMGVCWLLTALRGARELIAPRIDDVEVRTLLLVKFWGLGNIVLLLPVLRQLRQRYPEARIVFVSLQRNRELLDACEEIDERIYIRDRNVLTLGWTVLRSVVQARRHRPDLCVDFEQFAHSSAILAVLAGAKQMVGLATSGPVDAVKGRARLYHKPVRYEDGQHMGQTYLDLARAAGVVERLFRPAAPPIADADRVAAGALLAELAGEDTPVVVLHPGSGDNFQARRWPAESFAELGDRLVQRHGAVVVVTGTAAESSLTSRVVGAMRHKDRAIDASGRLGVLALAALLERAVCLVTNDTAPVHLGSAVGSPVFAFFGPNTPRLYGPLAQGSHSFYRALPCSPCLTHLNYKTSLCRMPVCIRDISVDDAYARVGALLTERGILSAQSPPRDGAARSAAGAE